MYRPDWNRRAARRRKLLDHSFTDRREADEITAG